MTVEQLIYDRLLANATIAAIVGTRVFQDYDKSPEEPNAAAAAFIVFGLEREQESEDITKINSWWEAEYAVACVATKPDDKVALANAVKLELKGIRGTTGDLIVKDSTLRDAADQVNEDLFAARLHMRTVYQEVWWRNT